MTQGESKIWRSIRDKLSRGPVRWFRNEVGVGLAIRHRSSETRQKIIEACIALAHSMGGSASRVAYGLVKGSGDLIGWETITITPEMVGKRIAVFASCEVKTDSGRERDEQTNWRNAVTAAGGIAFVARSPEEARAELDKPFTGV